MRVVQRTLVVVVGAFALLSGALATPSGAVPQWYVSSTTGDDSTCVADPGHVCATIQKAVDSATANDTILVDSAVYTGAGQVIHVTKSLTFSGGWNSAFTTQASQTQVDGVNTNRGIVVDSGVSATFERFHVINGKAASGGDGGGIKMDGAQLTLIRSQIENNDATGSGGGLAISSGTVKLLESAVWANWATTGGGGIEVTSPGALVLVNSTIAGNGSNSVGHTTVGHGGGIDIGASVVFKMRNVTVASNQAGQGGGIYLNSGVTSDVRNSIISGNTAPGSQDCFTSGTTLSVAYTLIGDTTSCSYTPGSSLVLNPSDPGVSGNPDTTTGPTLTLPLLGDSPALDAGDPTGCKDENSVALTTDQRGKPRVGAGCDLGAYELQPPANDSFAAPTAIAGANGSLDLTNAEATKETNEGDHAGDEGGASVWFRWTAPGGPTVINTTGSSFDPLLALYANGALPLTRVASNDDRTTSDTESRLCVDVPAGTYFIAVDGYGGQFGTTTLQWSAMGGGDSAPCATLPPTVTSTGPIQVGQTLTAHHGTWVNDGAATLRWTRCAGGICKPISGATGTTYTLTSRDIGTSIRLDELENAGSQISTSDPTDPVGTTAAPAAANGKVYFGSNRAHDPDFTNYEIYGLVPGADDTAAVRLTNDPASESGAAVSPDGSRLAFNHGTTIWTMNVDGTGKTSTSVVGSFPSWSPDGTRLAFVYSDSGVSAIGIMDLSDPSNWVPVLEDAPGTFHDVAWSPDGTELAVSFFEGGNYHVGVIGADGRGPIYQLTHAALDDRSVAWSPDGTQIAFARGSVSSSSPRGTLVVVDADGTDEHVVYDAGDDVNGNGNLAKSVSEVTWSPKGDKLLFNFGNLDLWTVSPDGTGAAEFAAGACCSGRHEHPSWAVPYTPPAPPAPPPSGGGGGGGGGGAGIADLQTTLTANAATPPAVGQELILQASISMKNLANSSETHLDLNLPGLTVTRFYIDRGSCQIQAPKLLCDTAWISPGVVTHVTVWTTVAQAGDLTLTSTVRGFPEPETEFANNTATLTLSNTPQGGGGGGSKAPPPQLVHAAGATGTPTVGHTLRASAPKWNTPASQLRYQWQLCAGSRCTAIPGATKPTLRLTGALAGKSIRLLVTARVAGTTMKSTSKRITIRRR